MGWKYHVDNNSCNRAPCCTWCRQIFDSVAVQTHHVQNNICGKAPFCGWCRKIFKTHQDAGHHIENNLCGLIPQDNEPDFIEVDAVASTGVISLIDDKPDLNSTSTPLPSIPPVSRAQDKSLPTQHNTSVPNVTTAPKISSQNSTAPQQKIEERETSQLSTQHNVSVEQKKTADEVNQDDDDGEDNDDDDDDICMKCYSGADEDKLLLCDGCDNGCHTYCCDPPLAAAPIGDCFCKVCDSVPCGKCNTSRKNNNHIRCHNCKIPYHLQCVQASEACRNDPKWLCPNCDIVCKYCQKWFKSADGLKYHLKNNVCRSSANPAETREERATAQKIVTEKIIVTEQDTSEQNELRRVDTDGDTHMYSSNDKNTVLDHRLYELPTDQHNEMEVQLPSKTVVVDDDDDDFVDAVDDSTKSSCNKCGVGDVASNLQFCDSCHHGYHLQCAEPPLEKRTEEDWYCKLCSAAPCVMCNRNHASDNNPVRCYLCRLPFHLGCITPPMAEYCKTWSCGKCKVLVCKYCNKSFKSADGLKYHKEKNVCRILVGKEVVAKCPHCSKSFITQGGYTYHMQNVCTRNQKRSSSSSGQKGSKSARASSDHADTFTSDGKRRRVSTDRPSNTTRDTDDDASVNSHDSDVSIEMVVKKRKMKRLDDDDEEDGGSDGSGDSEGKQYIMKKNPSSHYTRKIDVTALNWDTTYRAAKLKWNQHNIDGSNGRNQKCCLPAAIQASLQERVHALQLLSLNEWLGSRYNNTKTVHDIVMSLSCNMELRDKQGPDITVSPLSAYDRNQTTIDSSIEQPALEGVISVVPTVSTSSNADNPYYCKVCDMSFLGASAFISHEKSKIHNQLKTGSITLDYGAIASRGPSKQRNDNVPLRTDYVVNTCIPITSVAICPEVSPDGVAYAAIGGSHFNTDAGSTKIKIEQEFILGKTYHDPNLLQIWQIGKACKLLYMIGLRTSGPVWQCKWLSLEKVPDKIIGILSVICGDGTCLVLVVPNIGDPNLLGNKVVIDENQLILWKICLNSVALTATCWDTVRINAAESTLEMMCGSMNGTIYYWNLGLMATDLRTACVVDECTTYFKNIRSNSAHPIDSAISAISICPVDRALFLVASYNGSVGVWSKGQKNKPVFSKNYIGIAGWINDAKWDPNGMGVYVSGSDVSNVLFQRFIPEIGGLAEVIMSHDSYYACSNSIQACAYDGHTIVISAATDGTVRFCFPAVSTLVAQNASKLFASGQLFHVTDCAKDPARPGSKGQSKVSCDYYSKCTTSNSMVKSVVEKKVGFTSVDMIPFKQTPLCVYGSKTGLLRVHRFEDSICNRFFRSKKSES